MKLYDSGIYLVDGRDIIEEGNMTQPVSREEAASQKEICDRCCKHGE